jgi:hypothetical protein
VIHPFQRILVEYFLENEFKDYRILSLKATLEKIPVGSFYYIPVNPIEFLFDLSEFSWAHYEIWGHGSGKVKFIDLGCGPGATLLMAKELLFFDVMGIEIDPYMVKIGLEKKLNIIEGDFFEKIDLIKDRNLIYTYMPLSDPEKMEKLSRLIEKNMGEKSVWIEMLPEYPTGKFIKHKRNGKLYRFNSLRAFDHFVKRVSSEEDKKKWLESKERLDLIAKEKIAEKQ